MQYTNSPYHKSAQTYLCKDQHFYGMGGLLSKHSNNSRILPGMTFGLLHALTLTLRVFLCALVTVYRRQRHYSINGVHFTVPAPAVRPRAAGHWTGQTQRPPAAVWSGGRCVSRHGLRAASPEGRGKSASAQQEVGECYITLLLIRLVPLWLQPQYSHTLQYIPLCLHFAVDETYACALTPRPNSSCTLHICREAPSPSLLETVRASPILCPALSLSSCRSPPPSKVGLFDFNCLAFLSSAICCLTACLA